MRGFVGCAVLVSLAALDWVGEADATSQAPRSPSVANEIEAARSRGGLLFLIHCATCHGKSGTGDGPLASDLRVAPADLTRLEERNEAGEAAFPTARVRRTIDGREDLRGHGSREMPVWGLTFQDAGRDVDQEEPVRQKIEDLMEFLRTIQVPSSENPAG